MTREQADKAVKDLFPFSLRIEDYWVTARGLRVKHVCGAGGNLELTQEGLIPMPRAEAQALVDAGGE